MMAACAATQTSKPEQSDLTVDDDMHNAHDGTYEVLVEQERTVVERKREVSEVVTQHLGPQASRAEQPYVARLTELGRTRRRRRS